MTLRTREPSAKPRILHNLFAEDEDLDAIRESLRINMKIASTAPLSGYEKGRRQYPRTTRNDDLDDYIATFGQGFYHPSSTCAMGKVVDAELKVIGVEGLRVADASIMPTIVRGNPERCDHHDRREGREPDKRPTAAGRCLIGRHPAHPRVYFRPACLAESPIRLTTNRAAPGFIVISQKPVTVLRAVRRLDRLRVRGHCGQARRSGFSSCRQRRPPSRDGGALLHLPSSLARQQRIDD